MAEADPKLEQEFACLIARAGLTIPPERHAGVFEEFVGFQQHIKRIWDFPTTAASEPATAFRLARGNRK